MNTSTTKALRSVKFVHRHSIFHSGIHPRSASTDPSTNSQRSTLKDRSDDQQLNPKAETKNKTVAEQDEELRRKLEGISGDGGEAGLELENGQPVAMKRSVRENMFRLI